MAEKTDKEVCSICLNDFQQPVILDCEHSFCFICLEEYLTKTSTKDQFQCPLCRCLINVGDRGLQQYRLKPNINIQQCEDTCQYFCRNCDQYSCKSCKIMHDKMKICKDHAIFRYDENQVSEQSRSNETIMDRIPVTSVTNHKDFCPHHERKKVTIYCKDCSLAMCWKCFVASHNGHNYSDLQEDEVRQNMRQDLRILNDELETLVSNFQKHYDNLNSKLIEVKNCTKTECDKVDAKVDKICSEFRKIGGNIKQEMQESSEEEESKLRKLMEDIKILIDNLKASINCSVNVLEDSSIVQVLQRLPKVRQEKDQSSCRKSYIPDVRYSTFQAAEMDTTLLTNQLGKAVSCHRDIINVDNGWYGAYRGKQHEVSGFTWSVSVFTDLSIQVCARLYLDDVEDASITSCYADVTYKVINKADDNQSVVKQYNGYVDTGSIYPDTDTVLIDWTTLNNPDSGFIDDDGNFIIQVTINDVTGIERCI